MLLFFRLFSLSSPCSSFLGSLHSRQRRFASSASVDFSETGLSSWQKVWCFKPQCVQWYLVSVSNEHVRKKRDFLLPCQNDIISCLLEHYSFAINRTVKSRESDSHESNFCLENVGERIYRSKMKNANYFMVLPQRRNVCSRT